MKKNIIKIIALIFVLVSIMFAEYRFIMLNLRPYTAGENLVYIEMFGRCEEYYAESIE